MKKFLAILLIIMILVSGCTKGAYIEIDGQYTWVDSYGLRGEPRNDVIYSISVANALVSFVFAGYTIIIPAFYALDYIYIPVEEK